MALSPKSYLADLKVLQEIKELRGWETTTHNGSGDAQGV